ncbi:extracellular solute-binding protein [Paenibacillus sp. HB172176]|uniref:extracellular solute-binding protein n=1 Tax=Paenibacillus sp. HB172176 TaxID=2493690 RepID=UPI0014398C58|nr:extracellular solute-binding protein [Paenibacillus sp. HB172176]
MLRKSSKMLVLLLITSSLLAACSSNNNSNSTAGNNNAANATNDGGASATADPNAEPTQLSIFYFDAETNPISDDMPVIKKSEEATNVHLENVAPIGGEEQQAYNLMLSSGEIPDIVSTNLGNLNSIAVEGALEPLNDLIDQYAPNFKKFLDERPDVANAITQSDGQIFYVPFVADGAASTGWFIRQDWLDNLGLSMPKTVDEYHDALTAFLNDDPNGNKKKDEIPYFNRRTDTGVDQLLPLFDAFNTFYIKPDGQIAFGPYEAQYKDALSNLAQWYKEGLIDKEIYTRGSTARDTLLANDTGGSTHDWFGSTAGYNDSLSADVPGMQFYPMTPPASTSGKIFETGMRAALNGKGWAISAQSEDKEAAMKYFDFWWSEEGRRMFNFGVEGETYNMVDGQPIFTDEVLAQPSVLGYLISDYGAQLAGIGAWQDFNYEKQWTNEIALKGVLDYQDNNYIDPNYTLPTLSFTEEEQNKINQLQTAITTYVTETTQKWVMGGEQVDAGYDTYINQLKKLKIDELIAVYQSAYDRYMKK